MWCSYQHDWLQSYQDAEYISNDYEEICHSIYALITQKTKQRYKDELTVFLFISSHQGQQEYYAMYFPNHKAMQ